MLIIYVDTDLSTSVPLTDEEIVVSVQPTTGTGNASNYDEEEATCLPTPTNQCNVSCCNRTLKICFCTSTAFKLLLRTLPYAVTDSQQLQNFSLRNEGSSHLIHVTYLKTCQQ